MACCPAGKSLAGAYSWFQPKELGVEMFGANRSRNESDDIVALSGIAQKISSAASLTDVFRDAIEFVNATLPGNSCMIYVREADDFVLRASTETEPEVLHERKFNIGQGAAGWLAEQVAPILIPVSAPADPRFKFIGSMTDGDCEAVVIVPMTTGGRLVGAILAKDSTEHWYGQREVGLLSTLGFLIGTELERMRLEHENAQIEQKLRDRAVIERAKKLLQDELHISEEDAYLALQRESKRRRKPMSELAEAIILSKDLRSTLRSH
jgi:uroporphyrinogen-III synthase